MPLYEYQATEDGTTLELLRPASQADAPVVDPEGKDRTFVRRLSAFATGGHAGTSAGGSPNASGGCCPCGKNKGSCASKR